MVDMMLMMMMGEEDQRARVNVVMMMGEEEQRE